MSGFKRKLKRKNVVVKTASALTEAEYQDIEARICGQLTEEITLKILAVAVDILEKDYGKLKKRETRFDTLLDLFSAGLNELGHGDAARLAAVEKLLSKGLKVRLRYQ